MSGKQITSVIGVMIVALVGYFGYQDAVSVWQSLQDQQEQIQSLYVEQEELDKKLEEAEKSHNENQEEIKKLEDEKNELEKERERLEGELLAKKERKAAEDARLAAEKKRLENSSTKVIAAATGTTSVSAAPAISGNKQSWLAASIIPQDQWGHVDWLVARESGWNPSAVNRSSGACGLGQQLPCGKWPGAWNDPVNSLNNMHHYVMGRYGSWAAAAQFSRNTGWY